MCSVAFGWASSASRSGASSARSISTTWTWRDARGEVLGQHAEAAADLEHDVLRAELGRALDDAEDVRVDEEVLAEVALGPDAELARAPQARLAGAAVTSRSSAAAVALDRGVELLVRDAAPLGDEPRGVHDVGRLVALPPHGLRAELRRVGLHEQAVGGHARRRRGEGVVGRVGHVAGEGDPPAALAGTRRSGRASRSSGGSRRCRPRGRTAGRSSRPRRRGSG